MHVHLTEKSTNKKTGKIPVSTTEQNSCPSTCPFNTKNVGGCYAESGPLRLHWNKVSDKERGTNWQSFCDKVAGFKPGQLWRHNQAGDLPHIKGTIDIAKMEALIDANKGKRGFTYTHHDLDANAGIIEYANGQGFTVNVSANSIDHADKVKAEYPELPVVTVVDATENRKSYASPAGNKVVVCPATRLDNVSCETCKLCSLQRDFIIAFPAHGTSKKKAEKVAMGDNA